MHDLTEALECIRGWEQQHFPVSVCAIDTSTGCGGYMAGYLRPLNEDVMSVWSDDEEFLQFSLDTLKTATEVTRQQTAEGTSILFVLPAGQFYITDIVLQLAGTGHA